MEDRLGMAAVDRPSGTPPAVLNANGTVYPSQCLLSLTRHGMSVWS